MEKLSKIINLTERKEIRNGMLDFSKTGKEIRQQHRLALYLKLVKSGKLHINK